jgi:hypothetical protein
MIRMILPDQFLTYGNLAFMDQRPISDLEDTSEDSEIVQRHFKLE